MSLPLRVLEAAFVTNPFAQVYDQQWVYLGGDATALNPTSTNGVIKSMTIRRGRQQQTNKFEAGVLTAVLDNQDGRFDPMNTASPFYEQRLSTTSVSFASTGAAQTWVVPTGVKLVMVDAWGAQGVADLAGYLGGLPGRVQATIFVTPGETLQINVGGYITGWNGGGALGTGTQQNGGAGGGATDIRRGGTALTNRVLVAGGGGGAGGQGSAGTPGAGGAGGGTVGAAGAPAATPAATGGGGGTQSAGGSGGGFGGAAGALGVGGSGYSNTKTTSGGGGGGGGGYYGGGGGSTAANSATQSASGGGGGSNYVDPTAVNVTHTQGYSSGGSAAGNLKITYNNIGVGGTGLTPNQHIRLRAWVNRMHAYQSLCLYSVALGTFSDLVNVALATSLTPAPRVVDPAGLNSAFSSLQATAVGNGTMSFVARTVADQPPAVGVPWTPWDDSKGYPVTPGESYTGIASYQPGRVSNLLTANQQSFETNTAGWANLSNTTLTRSTLHAHAGSAAGLMTSIASGDMSITTPTGLSGIAVTAGNSYAGWGWVFLPATNRSVHFEIRWWNSAGTFISTTTGPSRVVPLSIWTIEQVGGVAPGGAAFASLVVVTSATVAAGEQAFVDDLSFGQSSPSRTCTTSIQWRDSGGALISTVDSSGVTDVGGGWTDDSVTGVAPATSAYASVKYAVASAVTNEVHYLGAPAFWAGAFTLRTYETINSIGLNVFHGFSDGWQCDYVNPNYSTTTLTASDALRLFHSYRMEDLYAMVVKSAMMADATIWSPSFYWRLNEAVASSSVADDIGTNPRGNVSLYNVTFQSSPATPPIIPIVSGNPTITNPGPLVSRTNSSVAFGVSNTTAGVGSITQAGPGGGLAGAPPWTIMLWINVNSGFMVTKPGGPINTLIYQNKPGGKIVAGESLWELRLNYTSAIPNHGSLELQMFNTSGGFSTTNTSFDSSELNPAQNLCDNRWYHLALTVDTVTPYPNVRSYINGVLVATVPFRALATPFPQSLNPITIAAEGPEFPQNNGFPGQIDEVSIYNNVMLDATAILGGYDVYGYGSGVTSGINRAPGIYDSHLAFGTVFGTGIVGEVLTKVEDTLMHVVGWRGGYSQLNPVSNCWVGSLDDMDGATLKDVLDRVKSVDRGYLFIGNSGAVVSMSRYTPILSQYQQDIGVYNPPTFSDVNDGSYGTVNIPYRAIQRIIDNLQIVNEVNITGHSGGGAVAVDLNSEAKYGTVSYSETVYHANQAELQDVANWILTHASSPRVRMPYIEAMVEAYPATAAGLLTREVMDLVRVVQTPPGMSTLTFYPTIQGIQHTITPVTWTVRYLLSLSDTPTTPTYFVLDSQGMGVLDTNQLAY